MGETREEWKARIGTGPAINSSALPTRSSKNAAEWKRMKRWEKEHDAARQLRKSGVEFETLASAPEKLREIGG